MHIQLNKMNPFRKSRQASENDVAKVGNDSSATLGTLDLTDHSELTEFDLSPASDNSKQKLSAVPVFAHVLVEDDDVSASKYGYEDHSPADYGCEDVTPAPRAHHRVHRRSSMKQGSGSRRASITMGEVIEVRLPGRSKPVQRRTSITFKDTVTVKKVDPVHNLTEDPEALWFQADEYDRMREKSYHLVEKVEAGRGDKKYCTRGLENLMIETAEQAEVLKYDGWDAVLNEQHLQKQEGMFNDEYMAQMYKFATFEDRKIAAGRAQKDAQEIENYLRETREYCRRFSM